MCWSGKAKGKNSLKTTGGGAGYTIKCETCGRDNMKAVYHGETSRTLYSRLTEHAKALEKGQENNPPTKHKQTIHGGEDVEYVYEPDRFFKDPLTRQINGGIRINRSLRDASCTIMNSKAEFRQGMVSRVEIVSGLRE